MTYSISPLLHLDLECAFSHYSIFGKVFTDHIYSQEDQLRSALTPQAQLQVNGLLGPVVSESLLHPPNEIVASFPSQLYEPY